MKGERHDQLGLRGLPDGCVEGDQLGKSPGGRWEVLTVDQDER